MITPISTRPLHKRYLGNTNTVEVHDLRSETTNCQIDTIIRSGHAVVFSPDNLAEARRCGYDHGHYCLGGSTR